MDWYLVSVIIFVIILAIIVWFDRKNFKRQGILLLRKTKRGRGFLIRTGQGWRGWFWIGNLGFIIGFLVSVWIVWQFLVITIQNLTVENVTAAAGFLLPSPFATASAGPGYFAVPFWYWIIAIALLIVVHEGFHGIMTARDKIKIKSLGWGLLFVIPLAFVEPDEKQLAKKPVKSQLRVFAAGSFANFCLAGISLLLLSGLMYGLFAPSGVAFQGWPATNIFPSNIQFFDNVCGNGFDRQLFLSQLNQSNQSLIELNILNETYLATPSMLMSQSNKSKWIVYEDLPAVRANLTGMIIQIENTTISDTFDLEAALEEAGPNRTISIVATNGTENKTFTITTATEPMPTFTPSWGMQAMLTMEYVVPAVEINQYMSNWWSSSISGQYRENWETIQTDIAFWKWAEQNYPGLQQKAEQKISELEAKLLEHPRAGYIGIASVYGVVSTKSEFSQYSESIKFVQGLLFWLFLINFGVGAFNLLPIRALDGGRMWELLFQKINRKYAKQAIDALSYLMVFLIIINFAAIFGLI